MLKLIAALGNPGTEYAHTRHNAGWMLLDAWAVQKKAEWKFESKCQAELARVGEWWLLKPQTFMNLSGQSVGAWARFYKIMPEELFVLHDEVAFDAGVMRLTHGGSSGGHNGVQSIIEALGTENFWRLRLGVGPREAAWS